MNISADKIRNIAVLGHSGEGKTTLCEAMLFDGGAITRMGKTPDGTTVMDYDDIEKQRQISINASLAHFEWQESKINLIDLPGFFDFEGERNEGLSAAGGALIVIDASGSLPIGAENAVNSCAKAKIPVIVFINGMDKANANYDATVQALQDKFPGKFSPVQLPIMESEKLTGYVDVITEKAYKFGPSGAEEIPVPASLKGRADELKASLTETAAENDEALLDNYFEEGALSDEEIAAGIKAGMASASAAPIVCGSALQNVGVKTLLDDLVRYMPTSKEQPAKVATDKDSGDVVEIACEEDGPLAAQIFKTIYDPSMGKLNYIRIYRGKLRSGTTVFNATKGKEERIGQIYILNGKKNELVTELTAGDIGAVNKLTCTDTNDTLCASGTSVQFDSIEFPTPMLSMAVTAVSKNDEDKMFAGFVRMCEEDYAFATEKRQETSELIISGQGETHLDIVAMKLKARNGIDVVLSEPKIPYRETIRATAEAEGKHKKQSGGHGQYGHCKVRFEPFDGDFEFAEEVVGGAVPKQYIPAVEKGLVECMTKGVLAGYPVTGVKAVLFDGSFHPVDSSEMAFKMAASLAFKDGMKKARPVLLEPIMKMRVVAPQEYLGAVMGDISKRRGRILDSSTENDQAVVVADVPLAEIAKYATDLRGLTRGQGRYSLELEDYEEVPPQEAEKIIAAANVEQ